MSDTATTQKQTSPKRIARSLVAPLYGADGKKTGDITLPESVFAVSWNADLVHQVIVSIQANARTPIAHTKGRAEVSGGGKKPWKQKGTGRARHGSIRSPIWKGGGVTFGPRNERDFSKKINKKMSAKALLCALSKKYQDGEILFIDSLSFSDPKTSHAKEVVRALASTPGFEVLSEKKHNAALFAIPEQNEYIKKSFSNLKEMEVELAQNLNAFDVLSKKFLVMVAPKDTMPFFESKMKKEAEKSSTENA